MSAAIMTMKTATRAADFISYFETLTAPRRRPFTNPLQRLLGDAVVTVLPDMPQRTQGSCPDAQQPKR
jgi:hypothetical protein